MLVPYLTFNGKCEEAFNLYAKAFGGGKTEPKFLINLALHGI